VELRKTRITASLEAGGDNGFCRSIEVGVPFCGHEALVRSAVVVV